MNPRITSLRSPRKKGPFLGFPEKVNVEIGGFYASVYEPGIENGCVAIVIVPRAVHHPKMGGAQFVEVECRGPLVWRGPVVFDSDKNAVTFCDFVTPHAHVHPRQVTEPCGFGDRERMVEAALVEPAIRIEPKQDIGLLMPKCDLVKLSTHPGMDERRVPLRIPHGHIQGFVFVVIGAGAQFLLEVQRRGKTPIRRSSGHTVDHPCAESWLQCLGFEKWREVFTRCFFEQQLKIGHIHVAVKPGSNHCLGSFAEHVVAEVGPKVVQDTCTLVVRVPAVNLLVGHGRERMKPQVLDVAFFEHKLLIVFDQIHKSLVPIFPLHKKVTAVFRGTFLEPHVVVNGGSHEISPPVVAEFVGKQVAIRKCALLNHGSWIGDVGWDF